MPWDHAWAMWLLYFVAVAYMVLSYIVKAFPPR